jgi:hypothetical protein
MTLDIGQLTAFARKRRTSDRIGRDVLMMDSPLVAPGYVDVRMQALGNSGFAVRPTTSICVTGIFEKSSVAA